MQTLLLDLWREPARRHRERSSCEDGESQQPNVSENELRESVGQEAGLWQTREWGNKANVANLIAIAASFRCVGTGGTSNFGARLARSRFCIARRGRKDTPPGGLRGQPDSSGSFYLQSLPNRADV